MNGNSWKGRWQVGYGAACKGGKGLVLGDLLT